MVGDPIALTWARGKRDDARNAVRAEHEARVAPYVAALDAALAVVEEAAREVMRIASAVFKPAEVMRIEHPNASAACQK